MALAGSLLVLALALAGVAYAEQDACLLVLKVDPKASQVRGPLQRPLPRLVRPVRGQTDRPTPDRWAME